MSLRQALLLSSSQCYGFGLLEFAREEFCSFLHSNYVKNLIYIPYAETNFNGSTAKIKETIGPWGIDVTGIHDYPDPATAINYSKAIFMGGGNTFLLLCRLYHNKLISLIKRRVDEGHLLYIGSSAGSNVATRSIHTTNDMPIIYPPTLKAIGIVPFNINPHYTDAVEYPTHTGETRDERIFEYMTMPHSTPVLGLREGAILKVNRDHLSIGGVAGAVLFQGFMKTEYPVGSNVSFLLQATDLYKK